MRVGKCYVNLVITSTQAVTLASDSLKKRSLHLRLQVIG